MIKIIGQKELEMHIVNFMVITVPTDAGTLVEILYMCGTGPQNVMIIYMVVGGHWQQ